MWIVFPSLMDTIRPWILKAVIDGPLKHHSSSSKADVSPPCLLPLEPFRTGMVQFIRFLTPHQWGIHRPTWVEAFDRQVVILVYLSAQIMAQFESDQKADKRCFGELGYPTFRLGGCRWSWDAPPANDHKIFQPQLCLKVVQDLPNKQFRFGVSSPIRFPLYQPNTTQDFRFPSYFSSALKDDKRWSLLVKKFEVTKDLRLSVTASEIVSEVDDLHQANLSKSTPSAQIITTAVSYSGPTQRALRLKARRNQNKGQRLTRNGSTYQGCPLLSTETGQSNFRLKLTRSLLDYATQQLSFEF
ncbi:hypothetical protein O181_069663 [Austropuccinia psidii MF-1]|uniref:Uncharacterized protein n=1 Tax=Austropuccinia psidii MF-1 TaxID=1389203 RepID=A0A9Q3F2J5_9BASI|nr:hypothetical protein [Austropuccinia psidii MF-1]